MTAPFRRPLRRPDMRRAVILFPSGFTLGNLFFGIFAIIAASRLQFTAAGVYVLLGGICDALDGRVARATNSGTEFGEELDSLVDAVSFGLAPAMIMYFAVLNRDGWDWLFVFAFCACAVLRLARFNIEQAGTAKTYFQGLPSPAAGITLASYYWFSQSWLYTYGAVGDLPWHVLLRFIMAALSMLMISNVPYPAFPRMGIRSVRGIGASVLVIGAIVLLASRKLEYFFPIALVYVAWGLARWVFAGLFERRQPTLPYDLSEGEDDDDDEEFELTASEVHASRQGHRDTASGRMERPRERGLRPERADSETAARPERAPRQPERPERPERAERASRPERPERPAAATRTVDAERPRDKKKDRAKRPDRVERPPRQDRPARPDAATTPAPEPVAPTPSGPSAITLGQPLEEPLLDDETLIGDEGDGDELETVAESGGPATEGAPTRKRKRRRRRGERKDRPSADAYPDSPYAAAPPAPEAPSVFTPRPSAESAAGEQPPSSPPPLPTPAPAPAGASAPASPPPLPTTLPSTEPAE
jgi:CDP-diacylglycerol--serine O-phosphatidyltransferase